MEAVWWRTARSWSPQRIAGAALLAPAAATLPAALPGEVPAAAAASLYVLAVVVAAAAGGLAAGLGASLISFLALNFFFTTPLHTFRVSDAEDLIALVVFLVVAVVVGTLVSKALDRQARIERREWEARLLEDVSSRLLAGSDVGDVMERVARGMLDMFHLSACEITTEETAAPVRAARGAHVAVGAVPESIPMVARGVEMGRLDAYPGAAGPLSAEAREVMQAFANQVALALESLRLQKEVHRVHLDAEKTQLQAAMFSSVTHDLRTPLASITASVTSLIDAGDAFAPEDRRELLETIYQEADRLNRLVGNLLDLARLRADALVPARQPADMAEVIESVLARLKRVLAHHLIRTLFRDDLPELRIDVVQIDQALTNLLENAANFSPDGSEIMITASRWRESVQVRVIDHGPGIPHELRNRVFEAFARGDGRHTGTGLGLAIAHAVVTAHGGRIWVEDTPGGGATVGFDLPTNEPRGHRRDE